MAKVRQLKNFLRKLFLSHTPDFDPVRVRQIQMHKEGNKMAFSFTNSKNKTYYLHKKDTTLKNGRQQTIYFFAKEVKDEGALDAVPDGYMVSESRNGLPVLKKAS